MSKEMTEKKYEEFELEFHKNAKERPKTPKILVNHITTTEIPEDQNCIKAKKSETVPPDVSENKNHDDLKQSEKKIWTNGEQKISFDLRATPPVGGISDPGYQANMRFLLQRPKVMNEFYSRPNSANCINR